jgi:hypothetical protein
MRARALLLAMAIVLPGTAWGQSAEEVERCFQSPGSCVRSAPPAAAPAPVQSRPSAPAAAPRTAPAPDYATVLNSPEAERQRIQQSLRTLDKYHGPIDGNLQSDATVKAIADWQRGHGAHAVGKLTPPEAQQLLAEAARVPIRRIDPSSPAAATAATAPPPAPTPARDPLKALRARLEERRKAAEPKANAAAQALVRDLKAYAAADGKGPVGEQFAEFARWYADNKAAGGTVGEIAASIDDYGDAKGGPAITSEVVLESKQGAKSQPHCLVFAWIEASPRQNTRVFSCDDVAGVEKWKTQQALRSAWR